MNLRAGSGGWGATPRIPAAGVRGCKRGGAPPAQPNRSQAAQLAAARGTAARHAPSSGRPLTPLLKAAQLTCRTATMATLPCSCRAEQVRSCACTCSTAGHVRAWDAGRQAISACNEILAMKLMWSGHAGADDSTRRAMEQRSLGHAMHTHLVEFLRSFLRTPALEVRGLTGFIL